MRPGRWSGLPCLAPAGRAAKRGGFRCQRRLSATGARWCQRAAGRSQRASAGCCSAAQACKFEGHARRGAPVYCTGPCRPAGARAAYSRHSRTAEPETRKWVPLQSRKEGKMPKSRVTELAPPQLCHPSAGWVLEAVHRAGLTPSVHSSPATRADVPHPCRPGFRCTHPARARPRRSGSAGSGTPAAPSAGWSLHIPRKRAGGGRHLSMRFAGG